MRYAVSLNLSDNTPPNLLPLEILWYRRATHLPCEKNSVVANIYLCVPNLGCQYIHTIFSYQHYVLELRTAFLAFRDDRPAIVPVVNARIAAFSKHWLDGKARPRFQDEIMVIFEMEHMRQHMNLRTNAMSGKLANNTIIVR